MNSSLLVRVSLIGLAAVAAVAALVALGPVAAWLFKLCLPVG